MGFNSFVKEVNGKVLGEETPMNLSLKNNSAQEALPLQMNGGGDVKTQNEIAKCFLHITVNITRENNPDSSSRYCFDVMNRCIPQRG